MLKDLAVAGMGILLLMRKQIVKHRKQEPGQRGERIERKLWDSFLMQKLWVEYIWSYFLTRFIINQWWDMIFLTFILFLNKTNIEKCIFLIKK